MLRQPANEFRGKERGGGCALMHNRRRATVAHLESAGSQAGRQAGSRAAVAAGALAAAAMVH